jgi:glycosyltransferase involved in cell wall biosynthesis
VSASGLAGTERGSLRILFLVNWLGGGGAERQLVSLASGLAGRGHYVTIGVFRRGGDYEADLANTPVRLHSFDNTTFWDFPSFFRKVIALTGSLRPDIVHGYMDTGNFVAAAVRVITAKPKIVWGIRSSRLDLGLYDRAGHILARLTRPASRLADLIIANSSPGAQDAIAAGYPRDRLIVIHNGIDINRFRPDSAGAERMLAEWKVPAGAPVIGMAARLDPMKGHDLFANAARLLLSKRPNATFVCAGEGTEPHRSQVLGVLRGAGLGDRMVWQGLVRDMPAFYTALTVATCCSRFGEGFSNATAEAMACGVPCVVTDVGDLSMIVGDTGIVVPRENPEALADAWDRLIASAGPERSAACRNRIATSFGVSTLVENTERALRDLLK